MAEALLKSLDSSSTLLAEALLHVLAEAETENTPNDPLVNLYSQEYFELWSRPIHFPKVKNK